MTLDEAVEEILELHDDRDVRSTVEAMMTIITAAFERGQTLALQRAAHMVRGNYGWIDGVYFDDLAEAIERCERSGAE